MVGESYYVVKPNAEMSRDAEAQAVPWLVESIVVRKRVGGRNAWTIADDLLQAKLLFLVWYWGEHRADAGLESLLPAFEISEACFDRHWRIEEMECVSQGAISCVGLDAKVVPTGRPLVDAWLSSVLGDQKT